MPSTARGQLTRQRIIESTAGVFDRMGFAAASLSELVESTGMTRGAFYFHFDSKDALAAAIVTAQFERWEQLLEKLAAEDDPLCRMIRFGFDAGALVRSDLLTRASNRLINERALINRKLPGTYPWWISTVQDFLGEADQRGDLPDLSALKPAVSDSDGSPAVNARVRALSEYVLGVWMGVQQASLASEHDDLPDRSYNMWLLLLPWLARTEARRQELLALVSEQTERMRNSAALAPAGATGN